MAAIEQKRLSSRQAVSPEKTQRRHDLKAPPDHRVDSEYPPAAAILKSKGRR